MYFGSTILLHTFIYTGRVKNVSVNRGGGVKQVAHISLAHTKLASLGRKCVRPRLEDWCLLVIDAFYNDC